MDGPNEHSVELLLRDAPEGQETIFDLLNEGGETVRKVEVSRRKLQPEPEPVLEETPHRENKARAHEFHSVDAFCDYIKSQPDLSDVVILADVERKEIVAVLNENTCSTDREVLTLKAIEHPLWEPWGNLLERSTAAIDFALFCMQNRRAIIEPNGREVALLFQQIKMSKNIEVSTGVGTKALNGIMCEVSIAGEKQNELVELPETIVVSAPLFLGSSPATVQVDLTVTSKGENVVVFCTAADVEQQKVEAFEEMVSRIKFAEIPGANVGLGCVRHRAWERLERSESDF